MVPGLGRRTIETRAGSRHSIRSSVTAVGGCARAASETPIVTLQGEAAREGVKGSHY